MLFIQGNFIEKKSEVSLGIFFYRMSLYQQLETAISKILDTYSETINLFNLNGLYHLMGNVSWGKGQIHSAIAFQDKAKSALEMCKAHHVEECGFHADKIESRYALYLFNVGLYKLYLWELEDADSQFEESIQFSSRTSNESRALKAECFQAFVKAAMGAEDEALCLAKSSFDKIILGNYGSIIHVGFYLWILGRAFRLLGRHSDSIKAFDKSSLDAFYEENSQAKARLLYGLAELDLDKREFEAAVVKCKEAVSLLCSIGAKSDLAEAYFHLGNAQKAAGANAEASNAYNSAISLFEEMNAPRQISRVKEKLNFTL